LATPSNHKYVPWPVVNGAHPEEDDENAIFDDVYAWACGQFRGVLPAGCNQLTSAPKIKIDLMFESLCPGCGQVITTSFGPALEKAGFTDMVDLTLVPYGNASESKQGDNYAFVCQHGATECYGNAIDVCILKHVTDSLQANKAVICIEQVANVNGKGFAAALSQCSATYKFSVDDVEACAKGDEGNALVHAAALATPSNHKYVPWPVVNGAHPEEDDENAIFDDVFSWACNTFTGNKPAGCSSTVVRSTHVKKTMNKSITRTLDALKLQLIDA
jgi:interferon gamma-inducible protein 30